ncbi:hypothetical protein TYRP_006351 [Tyrophagus putrescentiae]|nr:hypothetical protein TYRP_006351 [Tyrophagus putrescentiae]
MLSRGNRLVLLAVFGFLLVTSEFPNLSSRLFKAGSQRSGNELTPNDGLAADSEGFEAAPAESSSSSIFVDAQWGRRGGWGGGYGGYGGGYGRGGYGGGWGRGGYGGGWGRRGGYGGGYGGGWGRRGGYWG